jgi:hypothetical protein
MVNALLLKWSWITYEGGKDYFLFPCVVEMTCEKKHIKVKYNK